MMEERERAVEMFVAGLVLDPSSNAPIVILKDSSGEVGLPIWIGVAEASAIASALKNLPCARPMTHDLLKSVVDELGAEVSRIFISDLRENTFIAEIEVRVGDTAKVIDSRPSDAIAIAVRFGAQILVAQHVLAQAQVALVAVGGQEQEFEEDPEAPQQVDFANVEREKWEQILAEMDPEDFKYKM